MSFLILLALLWIVGPGTNDVSIAAEKSGGLADEPGSEAPQNPSNSTKNERRPLKALVLGATPEERARLDEERKRLSAAAAKFGTDPTAIVGYYQLAYGHNEFTNNLRADVATATVRVPITPNWLLQVISPIPVVSQPMGMAIRRSVRAGASTQTNTWHFSSGVTPGFQLLQNGNWAQGSISSDQAARWRSHWPEPSRYSSS